MKTFLGILLFFIFSITYGQFKDPKFGKIEISDLTMNKYDKDTTADALILFDNGNSRFVLNQDRRFQFVYERHCRVKIFKQAAFNFADKSIRLYTNGSRREALNDLKAATFNLVDGKIVKTKLNNDKIYEAEGKNYVDKRFAFPEVKEGSIIEYSYTITSDFLYNFRGWKFQYKYPAVWSQYYFEIPEYFNYRQSSKGYLSFPVYKNEQGNTTYNIHYDAQINTGLNGGRSSARNYDLKAITKETTIAIKDIPAFIPEPNIDCEDNYIQSLEFELSSEQLPNSMRKDYTRSWESVNKEMNDDEDFGLLLKAKGFVADSVLVICNDKVNDIDKAVGIYNAVQHRMRWNGEHRIWAPKGLKKPYLSRIGSSSEINLLLTLMLQTAGLKAYPVLFSTRDNGIAVTFYPTISKFNSVLSKLEIDGKVYLLDASDKYCPFGVLPPNDINGQGRVVNNLTGDWANLESKEKFKEVKSYALEISPEGKFKGSIIGSYDGYAGISFRKHLDDEKNMNDFYRKMQEKTSGLTINSFSISNRYDNYKPISDTLNVEISDHADQIGDKILFNPLLFETLKKNLYTLEERKYPVDYNYPVTETYLFDYTLPAGYQVESMPKPIAMKLPDNSISISYNLQNIDNKIKIVYRCTINKVLFIPDEYKDLKEMYDQIVKKHAEQVILKKVN